jgi:uncharacterized protein YndB with AHSA1/START domain
VGSVTEAEHTEISQTLRIRARPETVWRYWTDPQRMCEWWGRAAQLDARPGGLCVVDLGGGAVMRGRYLEVVPYERIVFTFGWEAHDGAPAVAPGSTRVEVTLTGEDGDTIMTLRHRGIPAPEAERHRSGWAHFLPLLSQAAADSHDQEAQP